MPKRQRNDYYVYLIYVDDIIRYVGKGTGKRMYAPRDADVQQRIEDAICSGKVIRREKHTEGLLEPDAYDRERDLIAKYKRECDGGPLWNKSLGRKGNRDITGRLEHGRLCSERLRSLDLQIELTPAQITAFKDALVQQKLNAQQQEFLAILDKINLSIEQKYGLKIGGSDNALSTDEYKSVCEQYVPIAMAYLHGRSPAYSYTRNAFSRGGIQFRKMPTEQKSEITDGRWESDSQAA